MVIKIAQAAVQAVEFPDDQRITGPERLQATMQGVKAGRFAVVPHKPLCS